jgi:hypothetical protein
MLLATLCSVQQAYADSSLFSGFNVTLKSETHDSSSDFSSHGYSFKASEINAATSLQIENTFAFDTLHIGLGASVQASPLSQGEIGPTHISSENQLSIYITPGIIIGESTLAYGKASLSTSWNKLSSGSFDATYKISGIGIGAGVKLPLWKKTFLMAEAMQIQYQTTTLDTVDIRTKSTALSVGFGSYF